jgi:uroporphyrinogen decarboxylase
VKPRDVVLEQIHHRETRPVPYTLGFEGDVAERLDAHYGSSAWRERLTPYIVSCAGIDTVREERVSEIHTRDAFGGLWRHDHRPFYLVEPAMKAPSFDNYDFPGPERFAAPNLEESARKAIDEHPDSFALFGCGWGLFEQSWRIRGFENALMDAAADPDFYGELLDRLTDLYLAHVGQAAGVPADAIMFGDDWGDQRGVILGPERWRRFIKPRWAKIYEAVHAQSKIVISHCCGSVAEIMPDIIEIGLDVLESVQPEAGGMNPYELKKRWGDKIAFWGCLGTQSTIPFGSPREIRGEIERLCREMGRGGGYILSPAKPIQPETPTENAAAVVEAFAGQDGSPARPVRRPGRFAGQDA